MTAPGLLKQKKTATGWPSRQNKTNCQTTSLPKTTTRTLHVIDGFMFMELHIYILLAPTSCTTWTVRL